MEIKMWLIVVLRLTIALCIVLSGVTFLLAADFSYNVFSEWTNKKDSNFSMPASQCNNIEENNDADPQLVKKLSFLLVFTIISGTMQPIAYVVIVIVYRYTKENVQTMQACLSYTSMGLLFTTAGYTLVSQLFENKHYQRGITGVMIIFLLGSSGMIVNIMGNYYTNICEFARKSLKLSVKEEPLVIYMFVKPKFITYNQFPPNPEQSNDSSLAGEEDEELFFDACSDLQEDGVAIAKFKQNRRSSV